MAQLRTDILVIGAGPAGSAAALAARTAGAEVLLVERKRHIGRPVQCAEYIPARLAGELGLDDRVRVQKITGMHTYIAGRLEQESISPGWTIDREAMDKLLADRAAACGCRILTATRAQGLDSDGRVLLRTDSGQPTKAAADVIIAADGPLSLFRRLLATPRQRLLPAVQMRFRLRRPTDFTSVYFDRDIVGGYGWVFPKGEVANVGLGFQRQTGSGRRARVLLEEFAAMLANRGVITGAPLASGGGWIPVEPMARAVFGKVVFAGDAAGHTHPITGAGIFSALSCGEMAGKWAAHAVHLQDIGLLSGYDAEWSDLFRRSLSHALRKRTWMEAEWQRFEEIIRSCWIAFGEYHAQA